MRKNVNDWTYTGAMNNIYETDCRINEYDTQAYGREDVCNLSFDSTNCTYVQIRIHKSRYTNKKKKTKIVGNGHA